MLTVSVGAQGGVRGLILKIPICSADEGCAFGFRPNWGLLNAEIFCPPYLYRSVEAGYSGHRGRSRGRTRRSRVGECRHDHRDLHPPRCGWLRKCWGSSFAAFDPALGTLNSVTLDVSGTTTFSGGGDEDNNAFIYFFDFQGLHEGTDGLSNARVGNGSATASRTDTLSFADDVFSGPGSISTSVLVVMDGGEGNASISSVFPTESVTYTYTPATPAAPEPPTWAMMGLGFAALAFAGYRQTKRPAATAA